MEINLSPEKFQFSSKFIDEYTSRLSKIDTRMSGLLSASLVPLNSEKVYITDRLGNEISEVHFFNEMKTVGKLFFEGYMLYVNSNNHYFIEGCLVNHPYAVQLGGHIVDFYSHFGNMKNFFMDSHPEFVNQIDKVLHYTATELVSNGCDLNRLQGIEYLHGNEFVHGFKEKATNSLESVDTLVELKRVEFNVNTAIKLFSPSNPNDLIRELKTGVDLLWRHKRSESITNPTCLLVFFEVAQVVGNGINFLTSRKNDLYTQSNNSELLKSDLTSLTVKFSPIFEVCRSDTFIRVYESVLKSPRKDLYKLINLLLAEYVKVLRTVGGETLTGVHSASLSSLLLRSRVLFSLHENHEGVRVYSELKIELSVMSLVDTAIKQNNLKG